MANRILKPDSSNNLILQDGDSVSRVTLNAGGTSVLSDEGGTSALSIQADGDIDIAENIYLASGKGIYFDGGTTSANYLGGADAYEEGTFNVTFTSNSVDDVTACSYTKIGSAVTVSAYVAVNDIGTGTHSITITSGTLPFVTRDQAGNGIFQARAGITRLVDDIEDGILMIAYYSSSTLYLVRGSNAVGSYEPSGMAVVYKSDVPQTDVHMTFCATYLTDA